MDYCRHSLDGVHRMLRANGLVRPFADEGIDLYPKIKDGMKMGATTIDFPTELRIW